jgi:hypothetical protein
MEQLKLNIRTLPLNPMTAAEIKKQDTGEKCIKESEVNNYLEDIVLTLYGISGILQTIHKSIDDEDEEGYKLRKMLTLCFEGLNELAIVIETGENSFQDKEIQINKVA